MKKTLHYLLLLCIFSSIPLALTADKGPKPEIRKEMQAYVKQHMMPVLKEHRLQFDKQLTATDKRQVNKMRQELKKLEKQRREFYKNGPRHFSELTEEQKAAMKVHRETRHRIYVEAGTMARKYEPQLKRIQQSLASHRDTWEKDLKAIADKAYAETEDRQFRGRGQHFGRMGLFHHLMRPAQFILWDVSAITAPGNLETANSNSVYPNPSSSANTIAYYVEQAGPVKITLLNDRGNSLRVLLNDRKATGAYSLDVSVNDLPNGIYFYKVESAAGVETLRFLKQ